MSSTLLAAAIIFTAAFVNAETHTVTFDNQCGYGTVSRSLTSVARKLGLKFRVAQAHQRKRRAHLDIVYY